MVKRTLLTLGLPLILLASVYGQQFYSSSGPIPIPERISFKQLSSKDTVVTDVVIISVRRLEDNNGNFHLSDNKSLKTGLLPMVASLSDTNVTMRITSDIDSTLRLLKKDRPTVLFIHGYGQSFARVVGNANRLRNRYGVNVVVFDWPSKSSNFSSALGNVRRTTPQLVQLLEHYKRYNGGALVSHTTLLMHSLGNYYYIRAVMNNPQITLFKSEPTFSTILFNAAAVRQKNHARFFDGYLPVEKTFIVQNKNDKVLHGAELVMWSPLLGRLANGEHAKGVQYIDFTPIAQTTHTLFLGDSEVELNNPFFHKFYSSIFSGKQ